LHVFSSNDEYKYNPECCICCNRPWVSRIKEIKIIINSLNINKQSLCYSKQDFDTAQLLISKSSSVFGHKLVMQEIATHMRWAENIIKRADVYGTI
jgi:hypothetical protein